MKKFLGAVFLMMFLLASMAGCTPKEPKAETVPATTSPAIETEAVETVETSEPTEEDDSFFEEEIPVSEEPVTEPETEPAAKPEKETQGKPVVVPDLGGNGGGGPHEMGEDEF